MSPKHNQRCPSGKTVGSLKIVMEHDTETRVCCYKDKHKHRHQDIGHNQSCECTLVRSVDVILCGDGRVEEEPHNRSRSATTMGTPIMEDLR